MYDYILYSGCHLGRGGAEFHADVVLAKDEKGAVVAEAEGGVEPVCAVVVRCAGQCDGAVHAQPGLYAVAHEHAGDALSAELGPHSHAVQIKFVGLGFGVHLVHVEADQFAHHGEGYPAPVQIVVAGIGNQSACGLSVGCPHKGAVAVGVEGVIVQRHLPQQFHAPAVCGRNLVTVG